MRDYANKNIQNFLQLSSCLYLGLCPSLQEHVFRKYFWLAWSFLLLIKFYIQMHHFGIGARIVTSLASYKKGRQIFILNSYKESITRSLNTNLIPKLQSQIYIHQYAYKMSKGSIKRTFTSCIIQTDGCTVAMANKIFGL